MKIVESDGCPESAILHITSSGSASIVSMCTLPQCYMVDIDKISVSNKLFINVLFN